MHLLSRVNEGKRHVPPTAAPDVTLRRPPPARVAVPLDQPPARVRAGLTPPPRPSSRTTTAR
jgi:hypothetical protein